MHLRSRQRKPLSAVRLAIVAATLAEFHRSKRDPAETDAGSHDDDAFVPVRTRASASATRGAHQRRALDEVEDDTRREALCRSPSDAVTGRFEDTKRAASRNRRP